MNRNIFISYRRDDDPGSVLALRVMLEAVFPPQSIFMDVDSIPPGRVHLMYVIGAAGLGRHHEE
jgi:hypothetical protein